MLVHSRIYYMLILLVLCTYMLIILLASSFPRCIQEIRKDILKITLSGNTKTME